MTAPDAATQTRRLPTDAAGVAEAVELLGRGDLVAFPTETVYGLGADARNGRAVAEIFAAKGRPVFNPLIVHVTDLDAAAVLGAFDALAMRIARAFWPGPLTLVLPRRDSGISDLVGAGLETLAIRVPAHPTARRLLAAFAGPVAAPSANPSGKVSPTTAAHVCEGLGGRVAAVLDGGACPVGLESTIIGFEEGRAVLLRPGGLARETIETVTGEPLMVCPGAVEGGVSAPGQLASHYAPEAALRLNAEAPGPDEVWLGFGPDPQGIEAPAMSLSPTGDLAEAAAALFSHLRGLDRLAGPGRRIAVARIPDAGLGLAINDRLRRAAAPR